MEEETNQEMRVPEESSDNLSPEAHPLHQETDADRRHRERAAAYSRQRTARLRARGLSARGHPLKDRHKNRNAEKQLQYQANFSARHKAARERLGLTIREFNQLPSAARIAEYNKLKTTPVDRKAKQRLWYHQNKDKVMAARRAKAAVSSPRADNGLMALADSGNARVPVRDRTVMLCPHCGWNIDAMRKAQAFVDGRVS